MKLRRETGKTGERMQAFLDDVSVIGALLILVLTVIFLTDAARYQWVLLLILALGVILNLLLGSGCVLRRWFLPAAGLFLFALALAGSVFYFTVL